MKSDRNRKTIGSGRRRPGSDLIRKAAKDVVMGKPVRQVMRDIGYADSTADKNQGALLENPEFKDQVGLIRAALLVKDKKIFQKVATVLSDGLEAQETKFFSHLGKIRETRNVVNFGERRQYAELVARIFGEFYQKEDETKKGNVINLNLFLGIVRKAELERGLVEA